jgi:hypothetical protein
MSDKFEITRIRGSLICAFLLVMTALLAGPAMAIDPVRQQDGWSGFVWGGVGYTELKNNLVAGHKGIDTGTGTIDSIDARPPADDDFHPVLAGEINYTWADIRTEVFFGHAAEQLLTLDVAQQLGVRHDFGDVGVLQLGVLLSSVPAEVWEDPFVEGEPRVDTDRDSRGLRLQWDQILGSNFEIRLGTREIDIDPERSGDFLVANGRLDPADQGLLDRNGDDLQLRALYKWWFAPGQRLDPQFTYSNHDRNGSAVSGDTYEFQLSWLMTDGEMALVVNGIYGQRDYDAANPIYGRKADADNFAINAFLVYPLPWKSRRWALTTMVLWAKDDSNIDFYDSRIFSVMTGLTYRFGNLRRRAQEDQAAMFRRSPGWDDATRLSANCCGF